MAGLLKGVAAAVAALLLLGTAIAAGANYWVWHQTHGYLESDLYECAANPVAIVFGTSYGLRGGGENPWYRARLERAEALWKSGLVDHLLLSGDNHSRYYNEPIHMWRDLRRVQIPDEAMTRDYAGFSTFDTLARSRDVFGLDRATLVSQRWHLPRALYIARALGIRAHGCATPSRSFWQDRRMWLRETVARVAMLADLYLLDRKPRFLGPRIVLPATREGVMGMGPMKARAPLPEGARRGLLQLRRTLGLGLRKRPGPLQDRPRWRAHAP